jgi:hypothetical protein
MIRETIHGAITQAKRPLKKLVDRAAVLPTFAGYLHFRATHMESLSKYKDADPSIIDELKREGVVVLRNYFSDDECRQAIADIESALRDKPQHVQKKGDLRIFGAEELSPTIMRFHADPKLQAVSNHYTCKKTVNVFTLGSRVSPDIWEDRGWHRDLRYRQFKAFLYLNEVTTENGPLQVIKRSHRMAQHLLDIRAGALPFTSNTFYDDQIARVVKDDPSRFFTVTGEPGTLILADVGMLHRGCPPRSGVRYVLTNYYFEREFVNQETVDGFTPVNPQKILDYRDNW